nr:DUF86 domain-containing protein [Candidatus Sigynarchaeum springense]
MNRDALFLHHILDSIVRIEKFVKNKSKKDIETDDLTSSAIIRQFEIIDEAAKNLSESFKHQNATLPWRAIAGMRDKLIHGYFVVDFDEVWKTIQADLPLLKAFVEKHVK